MLPFMPILNLPFIIILIHSIFINLFEIKEKWRLNFFIHSKHKLEQTLSLTIKWLMTSYQHNVHHPASLTLSVFQSSTPSLITDMVKQAWHYVSASKLFTPLMAQLWAWHYVSGSSSPDADQAPVSEGLTPRVPGSRRPASQRLNPSLLRLLINVA